MKNITRLALAFAVATIAALAPMAHAEDEAQLVGSGIQSERYYEYSDKDGHGTMFVKDGPKYNGGRPIYVTILQNGHVFYGKGTRTLASNNTNWSAYCEFWVYGSGISAKFNGYIYVKSPNYGYGVDGGEYFVNGSGSPYSWECRLDVD
jgi:hypothetical protein